MNLKNLVRGGFSTRQAKTLIKEADPAGAFQPIQIVPSLVGDDLVLTIPAGSVWGIDGDGIPYYDPDGAAVGEEALLVVGTDGSLAVTTIGA